MGNLIIEALLISAQLLANGKELTLDEFHQVRNSEYARGIENGEWTDSDENFELFDKTLSNNLKVVWNS